MYIFCTSFQIEAYEKYYIDRNFDRTGKVAVVITPGAGVFEVDRELMNVTKQRTIDYGTIHKTLYFTKILSETFVSSLVIFE